jgi:rare lipoprotein A
MDYKMQSGKAKAGALQREGADRTTVNGSARTGTRLIKTGTTVSIQSSFEEFLAQQTSALTGSRLPQQPTTRPAAGNQSRQPASQPPTTAPQGETIHVLQKGENVWNLAQKKYKVDPVEILRLNKISNPKNLHVGQRLRIPTGSKDGIEKSGEAVVASWYGQYHQGRIMANGAPFDMYGATIAHRDIAIGTEVELENPETGEKAKAVVTDRGPSARNRDVDLSYGLAKRLSIAQQGVGNLKMRVL